MDLLPNVAEEAATVVFEGDGMEEAPPPTEPPQHEEIFEPAAPPKVTKKKREATEKQKAHLKIIREKALARKREIQEEKRLEKAAREVYMKRLEEKDQQAAHYTRAEVDELVNRRFKEYEDTRQKKVKEYETKIKQEQQKVHVNRILNPKTKSPWDSWI